ncbi:MAG: CBS domain-containing protein [Spirochaetia bacterium]|nr:CBS domain-containing protein [Spirochaetia bacterium]
MEKLIKLRTLPVSALMRRDVATIKGSQTVADAIALMKEFSVTSIIVEPRNQDDTFGIITEKDILEKVIDPGEDIHKDPWNTQIHLVMSKPCVSVSPTLSIKYAIRLMKRMGIRRVPVVKDDKLMGVLSHSDILHAVENLQGDDKNVAI